MADVMAQNAGSEERKHKTAASGRNWSRAISNHVAYALLVYTGLHIFVTMKAVQAGKGAVLPYLALVVLVAAIIPACRWFEKRWETIDASGAQDAEVAATFRRDVGFIWLGAIGLPVLLTGACKGLMLLFG